MALTWRVLVPGTALTGAAAVVYAAPAGTQTTIQAASVTNPTGSVVQVRVSLTTGIAPTSNNVISIRNVPAGGVLALNELVNHKLQPGYAIFSSGDGCAITISGVENVP